ncbi:protein kinase [uncultured Helicobacter sp.]|uniref:protein kinase domain-containing protein n=1 Tax=uncultured Helicobacter sp. TaxID=175537 RepID=UPI002604B125|nr:protein kinase [uncultured Helicobacter sp.]
MDNIDKNNINKIYDELAEQISRLYIELYSYFKNEKLQLIFSTLHNNIVECFKQMNKRLPAIENNRHYNANSSRKLKSSIETARRLQKELKSSKVCFEIDRKYNDIFTQCLGFLQDSSGSEIPIGMNKIQIYEKDPIFISSKTIDTPNGKQAYELKIIGNGSYADVYKYFDKFYQCNFALKRLNNKANKKEIERFEKEFEAMKKIDNPYILKVYCFDKDKQEYIMEYADFTLKEYINKHNQKISKNERISIGCQILKAIQFLWNKDILHRDISLTNILIRKYDGILVVKVSDFGLIKEKNSDLTSDDTEIKGSLNEKSRLEKIGFKSYSHCDEIYTLSKVLYFVATGKEKIENAKCDFLHKGTNANIEERYKDLESLKNDFIDFCQNP